MNMARLKYKSRTRGVPIGYVHIWNYPNYYWWEKKVAPGKWITVQKGYKIKQNRKGTGGLKPGQGVTWQNKSVQTVVKTGPGIYYTKSVGTKRLIKGPKRRKYGKKNR